MTAENIKTFVGAESMALVTEFSDETAPKIFGGDVSMHLLFFVSKEAENSQVTFYFLPGGSWPMGLDPFACEFSDD